MQIVASNLGAAEDGAPSGFLSVERPIWRWTTSWSDSWAPLNIVKSSKRKRSA